MWEVGVERDAVALGQVEHVAHEHLVAAAEACAVQNNWGVAIAIAPELRPAVGTAVTIGKTTGRVVRHIDDGFAIEFTRLQHPDSVEDNITGE